MADTMIRLLTVVNGLPKIVRADLTESVDSFATRTRFECGYREPGPWWECRDASGEWLDGDFSLAEVGLCDEAVVYLSRVPGEGA